MDCLTRCLPIPGFFGCDNPPPEFDVATCVQVSFTMPCAVSGSVGFTGIIAVQKGVATAGPATNLSGYGQISLDRSGLPEGADLFALADCVAGGEVSHVTLQIEWSYNCATNRITFTLTLDAPELAIVVTVAEWVTADAYWNTRASNSMPCVDCTGTATLTIPSSCGVDCDAYACYPICVANICNNDPATVNASAVFITANDGTTEYNGDATWNSVDSSYSFSLDVGSSCGTLSGRIYCDGASIKVDFDLFDGAVHTYVTYTVSWTCVSGDVSWTTPDPVSGIACGLNVTLWTNNSGAG